MMGWSFVSWLPCPAYPQYETATRQVLAQTVHAVKDLELVMRVAVDLFFSWTVLL